MKMNGVLLLVFLEPVSYTHLDVYKRQALNEALKDLVSQGK